MLAEYMMAIKTALATNDNKPIVLIHRGLPGSGKTTAAKEVQKYYLGKIPVYHHEADHFHETRDGEYNWKPENVGKAHTQCKQLARESMELAKSNGRGIVVVSNTNTMHKEMESYLEMADELGIPVYVFTFGSGLSLEELHKRNVHSVPINTLERMKARWQPYDGEIVMS